MRAALMLAMLCWTGLVWADYRKTPSGRFDLTALHGEFRAAGINLEGATCRDERGTIICHRDSGDFTDAEKALMDAALAAHDPDVRTKRQAQRRADRVQAEAKLKALGLTQAEIDALGAP